MKLCVDVSVCVCVCVCVGVCVWVSAHTRLCTCFSVCVCNIACTMHDTFSGSCTAKSPTFSRWTLENYRYWSIFVIINSLFFHGFVILFFFTVNISLVWQISSPLSIFRDVAAAVDRQEQFSPDRMHYVVSACEWIRTPLKSVGYFTEHCTIYMQEMQIGNLAMYVYLTSYIKEVLFYVHRNRRFIRDGSPGHPPQFSHSSELWQVTSVVTLHILCIHLCREMQKFKTITRF